MVEKSGKCVENPSWGRIYLPHRETCAYAARRSPWRVLCVRPGLAIIPQDMKRSLADFGAKEDTGDVLTFRKWLHHLAMVLGGLLVAMANVFPFLFVLALLALGAHWLGWL